MAGFYQWSSANSISNESQFRAWAGGISGALRRVFGGSDGAPYTGNRVDASVVAQNWNATIAGYSGVTGGTGAVTPEWAWEVWRLPDYGTMGPLYIRIGYCISGPNGGSPGLSIRVGTSYTADGSGNLTGVGASGSVLVSNSTGFPVGTVATNWASCDNSGFAIVMGIDHPSGGWNTWWFVVDRHRNVDGTPMNTAVAVFRGSDAGAGTGIYLYDLVDNTFLSQSISGAPCVTQGNIVSTTVNLNANNEVQVYPWWTITKNSMGVSKMICTHAVTDIVSTATQQVRWLPATGGSPALRTIRSVGTFLVNSQGYDINAGTTAVSTGTTFAIWWSDP